MITRICVASLVFQMLRLVDLAWGIHSEHLLYSSIPMDTKGDYADSRSPDSADIVRTIFLDDVTSSQDGDESTSNMAGIRPPLFGPRKGSEKNIFDSEKEEFLLDNDSVKFLEESRFGSQRTRHGAVKKARLTGNFRRTELDESSSRRISRGFCHLLCNVCEGMASRRWSILCGHQCESGGLAFDVCLNAWRELDDKVK